MECPEANTPIDIEVKDYEPVHQSVDISTNNEVGISINLVKSAESRDFHGSNVDLGAPAPACRTGPATNTKRVWR